MGNTLLFVTFFLLLLGFPGGMVVKSPPADAGGARDTGSIPGLEKSLGVGNSNPLQNSCLKNSMDRGNWQATVHGIAKSRTQLRVHRHTHTHTHTHTLSIVMP